MRGNKEMKKQAGVALFVCLMILLVLSLLGVSALRMVTSQNLISSSSQGADIAFDAAETGINSSILDAQKVVFSLPTSPDSSVTRTYAQDNRGISTIAVVVSMPDPTSNVALGKSLMEARLAMGEIPGVVVEQFRFESTSTVDALDIKTTHVQDTIYPHLRN
ncbi:MAG: PilX N-terminal domain-containing pilus assembly protein [Moraxellaceae bacterium]